MQYMGSKGRFWKQILPIILKNRKSEPFVDLFCGSCSIVKRVDGVRYANDANHFLIEFWKKIQNGWIPPAHFITKELWLDMKANKENYPPELIAFYGFCVSFGGKWWNTFAPTNSAGVNYAERGSRLTVADGKLLQGVHFTSQLYHEVEIPEGSIVYCDPPYENKEPYEFMNEYKVDFNHEKFWQWCRDNNQKYKIYISEYSAPEDFRVELEIETKTVMNRNIATKRVERLYSYGG